MALIEWSDELSVGITEIDEQHRHLIGIINRLHTAMKERKAKTILSGIIQELSDYTNTHFQTEEGLFKKFDYPETFIHMQVHKKFVKQVSRFQKDFDDGKLLLSLELMSFLKDWLENHIKVTDMKYSDFLRKHKKAS